MASFTIEHNIAIMNNTINVIPPQNPESGASLIGCVIVITGEDAISNDRRKFQQEKMADYFGRKTLCYVSNTNAGNISARFPMGVNNMKSFAKDPHSRIKHTACYHSHILAALCAQKYMDEHADVANKYSLILEDDTVFDFEKWEVELEKYVLEAIDNNYDIIKFGQSTVPFDNYNVRLSQQPTKVTDRVFDAPNFMGTFAYVLSNPHNIATFLLNCAKDSYALWKSYDSGTAQLAAYQYTYYPVDLMFAFSACAAELETHNIKLSYMPYDVHFKICTFIEQICETYHISTILGRDVGKEYNAILKLGHRYD
jgi:GR25 family glycosyltransferase involved in LPS biosynthesis